MIGAIGLITLIGLGIFPAAHQRAHRNGTHKVALACAIIAMICAVVTFLVYVFLCVQDMGVTFDVNVQ